MEVTDMFKRLIWSIVLTTLLSAASGVQALTITTEDGDGADTYLSNDGQGGNYGPDSVHGADVSLRAFRQLADVRSKTAYIRFDLSDAAGDMSGATLTFEATFLKASAKAVEVYGLIDGEDDSWDESTTTYNTAPGMIPNPPTTLGNYALDMAKVTLLGTITTPAEGDPYPVSFSSNPTDLPLTDFLSADTNKLVTFLFIGTDNEGEIASKEHATFMAPTLTLPNVSVGAATNPNPADGAEGVSPDVVFSWKTGVDLTDPNFPNPAITGHFLWLSAAYDQMNPPLAPDWQDPSVQVFEIGADTNPADGSVDPTASYSMALQMDALYFWAVDESLGASGPTDADNLILGGMWSFETLTSGPQADAGSSIVTWLKEGATTVDLNGTVTDATGDVTAILWSVVASPPDSTVDIADTSVVVTTATLTATGQYVLELYAVDAVQHEDADTMEINVYGDSCEAAKNNPNGYTAPLYDFSDDCEVDFIDFAMFADNWLEDASLTEDALYDPDATP
jgi:hypothetical protein